MMNELKYEMIVYWDPRDEIFVVEVPELPGCMAHGATKREAIEQAEQAASLWIKTAREDNQPIPVPKGKLMYA